MLSSQWVSQSRARASRSRCLSLRRGLRGSSGAVVIRALRPEAAEADDVGDGQVVFWLEPALLGKRSLGSAMLAAHATCVHVAVIVIIAPSMAW
jgi:hypothetical protein